MSAIGPELPPHILAKRKRQAAAEEEAELDGARAATDKSSPNLEKHSASSRSSSRSSSRESVSKRRRIIGPAPPPAPLHERPLRGAEDGTSSSSSSEDDDFGPKLPRDGEAATGRRKWSANEQDNDEDESSSAQKKPQRDEWMMVPPKQDDLAARMDPTKIRARGFNTGKGPKGPNQAAVGGNAVWTETPEQKRKRLEDEVMGVSRAATDSAAPAPRSKKEKEQDDEKARRIKEHNDTHRATSLYSQHQGSGRSKEEDDPSKRAFDYGKDMGGGAKIGHAQKREMLGKAANFGSRFTSGRYL